jgi:hypothetical protein
MAFARRDECIVEEALPSMLAMEDCRYQSSRSPRSRADIASSFNTIRPVGRVFFNPPFQARWRVKENPPYDLSMKEDLGCLCTDVANCYFGNAAIASFSHFTKCSVLRRPGRSTFTTYR